MCKKILIVRSDGIGDFVIFTAVIEEYAKLYPEHEIDILCQYSAKGLAVAIPFVSKVFCINPYRIRRKKYLPKVLYTLLLLNLRGYEKIIYPVYSREKESEHFIKKIMAKEKIAFDGDVSNDPDNQRFQRNSYFTCIISGSTKSFSEINRNAEFVNSLGGRINTEALKTKIWFTKEDEKATKLLMEQQILIKDKYICIFPGAGHKVRYWQNDSWVSLIRELHKHYPEFKIVVLGFGTDLIPIREILQSLSMSERKNIVDLYAKTTLREMAKLIEYARLFIGVDTAAVHIAAAVNTPNICILGGGHFGKTQVFGRFYPYGDLNLNRIVYHKMDCFDCNWRCIYDETKCIKNITVEDVWHEVEMIMGRQKVR